MKCSAFHCIRRLLQLEFQTNILAIPEGTTTTMKMDLILIFLHLFLFKQHPQVLHCHIKV